MRFKIFVLVINYNYQDFLLNNQSAWKILKKFDNYIVVDDQSLDLNLDLFPDFLKNKLKVTNYKKTKYNYLNQINAIKFGLDCLSIDVNDKNYIWVMDADDIPKIDSFEKIKKELNNNNCYELFLFSKNIYCKSKFQFKSIPKMSNKFWYKNFSTGSIVFDYRLFVSNQFKITSDTFRDIWFDIRMMILCKKNKIKISKDIIFDQIFHDTNDSYRYRRSLLLKYYRIIRTFFYYLYNGIIK